MGNAPQRRAASAAKALQRLFSSPEIFIRQLRSLPDDSTMYTNPPAAGVFRITFRTVPVSVSRGSKLTNADPVPVLATV
jgi:hypothetical protein